MLNFIKKFRVYFLLFVVILVVMGGSIFYLYSTASKLDTVVAKQYPASSTGIGGVTMDNVVLAKNLVEHGVFSRSAEEPFEPDVWRTPGYPVFVALFYFLFGSFYPVLFAQIFILFLTTVLIFKMAKVLMGEKWALALAILYVLLPDTILSTSALFNENLFVFFFVLSIYTFFYSEIKYIYLRSGVTGFLLALTVYIRPASLYVLFFFIPAYLIFYLSKSEISKKHIFTIIVLIVSFVATLSPWCIRNQKETGVFSFGSTGSFVLFRQNATQFYAAQIGKSDLEARYLLQDRAGIPRGPVSQDIKYSAVMKKVAIDVILEHPFRYVLFHTSTFIPFFTSSGAHEYWRFVQDMLPDFDPAPEPSLIQALNPFSLPVLITVIKNHGWTLVENLFWAVITVLVCAGLWRSKDVRLARMFFVLVIYFAVVTGPIAHARYRIPVEPLLLIVAFSTLAFWLSKYREQTPGSQLKNREK